MPYPAQSAATLAVQGAFDRIEAVAAFYPLALESGVRGFLLAYAPGWLACPGGLPLPPIALARRG
jgi:hypothetical protein